MKHLSDLINMYGDLEIYVFCIHQKKGLSGMSGLTLKFMSRHVYIGNLTFDSNIKQKILKDEKR